MRQVGITLRLLLTGCYLQVVTYRLLLTGCYLQVDTVIYADSAVRG